MPKHLRRQLTLATLITLLLGLLATRHFFRAQPGASLPATTNVTELARQVRAIERAEEHVAQTVWAKELLAEKCGRVIDDFWDRLNLATNKWSALSEFPFGELQGPALAPARELACGIHLQEQSGPGQAWTGQTWKTMLGQAAAAGWQIARTEFRHLEFDTAAAGKPARSRFYFSAHLVKTNTLERAILEGDLEVRWQAAVKGKAPVPQRLETRGVSVRWRTGEPGLKEILSEKVSPLGGSYFIDPLILYDLDGDGLSEIVLAASNLVYRRGPGGQLTVEPLCRHPPGLIFTGLIADFDGDGSADFLCAKFDGLYLFAGSPGGTFDEPGRLVWAANPRLRYPQTLTCGDVDGDGHLDVWLGQYKPPYPRGQMPTPYYDANDGYPSYLLHNDGHGQFIDMTAGAGLGQKRWRRAYSASLVDFNSDKTLDLVVANDFAGLELYVNDGHGHFRDVTGEALAEQHSFGMSQICSDFNADGRLDLLIVGMSVPVADRLRHNGQARPGFERYLAMNGPMTSGNRLFVGQPQGVFRQTELNESMARSGWSWGCSAFDLDNDGYMDLAIANGHETKQSVREYETEFWLHDIYVGNSSDNLAAFAYFETKFARTRGQGMSYGGYEKHRLYLNQGGQSFVEVAHLMGVGLEEDGRNVVADDLDGDGRMDLLMTTFEVWPEPRQMVRVFRNTLATEGHWIGFRLREQGQGRSPVGAQVTVRFGGRSAIQSIVAGDSYRSQRANTLHFGLGPARRVDRAEVTWPNGRSVVLDGLAVDRYYSISEPLAED